MEVRVGYKQAEFGNIPKEWRVESLGDVGEVKMCKRVYNNQTMVSGPIPFYKIGTFGKEPDAFIAEELFNNYKQKYYFPKKGDILISASGTIGRTVVYDGKPAYFQDSNIIWIDNNETIVSNSYLYYVYQVVDYRTEGQTIQRLYNDIIKTTKFICPPKQEQTAIAQVLSDTDELISSLEKLIEKKKLIKQGTMQQLLTGKKRLPGFSEEWRKINLNSECEIITKGTTPTSIGKEFKRRGINFLKIESLSNDNRVREDMLAFIDIDTNNLLKRSQLKHNDILFSIAGALGRVCVVSKNLLPANTNQALAIIRLKENSNLDQMFLFYFLRSSIIEKHYKSIFVQGAQSNLSLINVRDFPILCPSKGEQIAISKILMDIDKEMEILEQKLKKYKSIKQGMMQNLLTGKIRLV